MSAKTIQPVINVPNSATGILKLKGLFFPPLGPRKAGRIFRGGARETHNTRVTKNRLLGKPRSFSNLPAFQRPNGMIFPNYDNSTFQNSDMRLMILIPENTKRCLSNPTAAKDLVTRIILRIFLTFY